MHSELNCLVTACAVGATLTSHVASFNHSSNVKCSHVVQLDGPILSDGGGRIALGLAHHQGQHRSDVGRVGLDELETTRGRTTTTTSSSTGSIGTTATTTAAAAQPLPEFDIAILTGSQHVPMLGGAHGAGHRRPVEVGYLVVVGTGDVG